MSDLTDEERAIYGDRWEERKRARRLANNWRAKWSKLDVNARSWLEECVYGAQLEAIASLTAERDALKAENARLADELEAARMQPSEATLRVAAISEEVLRIHRDVTSRSVIETDSWRTFCFELGAVGWAAELKQASEQLVFLEGQRKAATERADALKLENDAARIEWRGECDRHDAALQNLSRADDRTRAATERAAAAEQALRTLRDTVDDLVDAAIEKDGEVRRCTVCDTEWRTDVPAGWPRHSDGCAIETLENALTASAKAEGAGEGEKNDV